MNIFMSFFINEVPFADLFANPIVMALALLTILAIFVVATGCISRGARVVFLHVLGIPANVEKRERVEQRKCTAHSPDEPEFWKKLSEPIPVSQTATPRIADYSPVQRLIDED